MQKSNNLIFIGVIAFLIAAAVALLFFLGFLPNLIAAAPIAGLYALVALILPSPWSQACLLKPAHPYSRSRAVLAALILLLLSLTVIASVPTIGSIWGLIIVFAFADSLFISIALTADFLHEI